MLLDHCLKDFFGQRLTIRGSEQSRIFCKQFSFNIFNVEFIIKIQYFYQEFIKCQNEMESYNIQLLELLDMKMEKITRADRIIKDLSFLLELKEQEIVPGAIFKYQLTAGTGEQIAKINLPCQIYFSLARYDYEGKYHSHSLNVSLKHPDDKQFAFGQGVYQGLVTMKLNQKSWFNITDKQLHKTTGLDQGCHFQIVVNDIRYKNSDSMQSKKLLNQRNRAQAKQLFNKKEYVQAMKKYRNIINITEGLQKNKYNQEQKKELNQINLKAKENFTRCYIQLDEEQRDEELDRFIDICLKLLLDKRKSNALSLLLKARVLQVRKYLNDSLEYANKLYEIQPSEQNKSLVNRLKSKIK